MSELAGSCAGLGEDMRPRSCRTGMHRAARPILLLPFNMLQATDQAPAPKWIVLGSDAWGIIQTALTDISAIETQRMLRSPQLDRLRVNYPGQLFGVGQR